MSLFDSDYEHKKRIEKCIHNSVGVDTRAMGQAAENFFSRNGRLPHQNELKKEYSRNTGTSYWPGPEDF